MIAPRPAEMICLKGRRITETESDVVSFLVTSRSLRNDDRLSSHRQEPTSVRVAKVLISLCYRAASYLQPGEAMKVSPPNAKRMKVRGAQGARSTTQLLSLDKIRGKASFSARVRIIYISVACIPMSHSFVHSFLHKGCFHNVVSMQLLNKPCSYYFSTSSKAGYNIL